MIGHLPISVEVDGTQHNIRTDYRDILRIFEAISDDGLSNEEKWIVTLTIFYEEIPKDTKKAMEQFIWFVNRGEQETKINKTVKPVYDWEQDEQIIFQAVNKVAGREVRSLKYMHWWTFLGLFSEIGESTFTSIVNIRNKRNKGKKLEKHEQEFYNANRQQIDLKRHYSAEQMAEMEKINKLLGF